MLQWQGKPLAGSSFLGNLASAGMGGSAVHSGGSPPKYMLECLQRETACHMLCQACGRHQTQPPGQTPWGQTATCKSQQIKVATHLGPTCQAGDIKHMHSHGSRVIVPPMQLIVEIFCLVVQNLRSQCRSLL